MNQQIAGPMSRYPEYRSSNLTWGRNVVGSFIVEVESESGAIGVGVSTGGIPGCWLVEHHLAQFVNGRRPEQVQLVWDQMWRASLYYGRRGLAINAISAVDLALWDLLGKLRGEPVHHLIGGAIRSSFPVYATGPRPDIAARLGFIGGKFPLKHGPVDGEEGLAANLAMATEMQSLVKPGFFLACDAWMALDVPYAVRLMKGLAERGFWFLEDFLVPDDYDGFAQVRAKAPPGFLTATGEHESTLAGFRTLVDRGCCDIAQPDPTWCGGLTELLRISAYCEAHRVMVIPHAGSAYAYHFVVTRPDIPFGEFVMASDDGTTVVPMYGSLFTNEPLPESGLVTTSDRPGFGLELNPDCQLDRPFKGRSPSR